MQEKKYNKKTNDYIEIVKNIWKSKRGKAVLFFLFYFIFFFLLITSLRSNYAKNKEQDKNTNSTVSMGYKLDAILNKNYHFQFQEIVDGVTYTFKGEKNKDRSKVSMISGMESKEYFFYSDIALEKIEEHYKTVPHPYHFPQFLVEENINTILKNATFINKTTYQDAREEYHFEISTTTLEKIVNDKVVDLSDMPNKITVITDQDKKVVKINYELSPYYSYIKEKNSTAILEIEYSNFDTVEKLEIPQ